MRLVPASTEYFITHTLNCSFTTNRSTSKFSDTFFFFFFFFFFFCFFTYYMLLSFFLFFFLTKLAPHTPRFRKWENWSKYICLSFTKCVHSVCILPVCAVGRLRSILNAKRNATRSLTSISRTTIWYIFTIFSPYESLISHWSWYKKSLFWISKFVTKLKVKTQYLIQNRKKKCYPKSDLFLKSLKMMLSLYISSL